MKILVTGGAGFIGSHVADAYLKAGHEVAVVDNLTASKRENLPPSCTFQEIDLLDEPRLEAFFKDFRPELVSHHAALVDVRLSWEDPVSDARTNILGSLALLRQIVRWRTRKIIYSSSGGAVYGEPVNLPVKEDDAIHPLSNYGVSKYAIELYIRSFQASADLRAVILRYPNVYGPRQDPAGEAGVVAVFSRLLLQGERPRIFGDGTKTRDYLYIDDVIEANLLALQTSDDGVYNLGWGRQITDWEVFQAVRDAVGASVDPLFERKRPGEIDHICLDATRARTHLGWSPKLEFSDGVARTVAYWRCKAEAQ